MTVTVLGTMLFDSVLWEYNPKIIVSQVSQTLFNLDYLRIIPTMPLTRRVVAKLAQNAAEWFTDCYVCEHFN